jgi:hypothetical protein
MISPYSPLPRILTRPEAVPAVGNVQVSKAQTTREPGRSFEAPAGRYDDVIQTSAISIAVPAQTEIARAYVSRTGCSPDYCRITGQLSYVHTDGGLWVVRYASVDREDRFGGSVVLAPVVSMDNFKEGDLVTVTGEVLNDGQRASKFLGGPLYRTTSISLVDRQTRAE